MYFMIYIVKLKEENVLLILYAGKKCPNQLTFKNNDKIS